MFPYNYLVVLAIACCANCIPISKRDEGSQCVNVYNECPEWKNAGFCEQHQEYMKSTCPVTCGYCKGAQSAVDGPTLIPVTEAENAQSYSAQYLSSTSAAEAYPTDSQLAAAQFQQPYVGQQLDPVANSSAKIGDNQNENAGSQSNNGKSTKDATNKDSEKEKKLKEAKSEVNSDELDSMPDDDLATNEQSQPSSKHIESEVEDKGSMIKGKESKSNSEESKVALESHEDNGESGISGSGQLITTNNENANIFHTKVAVSRDFIFKDRAGKSTEVIERFDNSNGFNDNVPSSSETASELDEEEDDGSSESVEASGSSGDASSGLRKSNSAQESGNEIKNADNKNEESKKAGGKATEQERTENAEKYEDEKTEGESKAKKPVQQKKKNLMESMLENGSLKAISVAKGKAREKVPNHSNVGNNNEDDEDSEEDATNIDLDFEDTGLEHFSGSGGDDGKVHLTLRQNFDSKYEDKTTPAYKILSGNFEKDMDEALGGEDSVSDVNFSEAEVEGNPRTTGKVRVNFKFNGDYNKLQNIVKSGSINGLLVVKNSLEGPMLNLEESE